MKIKKVICSGGRTGFFFDDQKAIKQGAKADGSAYIGEPATPGFTAVRQSGESISVQLILEDGQIAYGDCAAVQYSGAGGRDPLFLATDFIPFIYEKIAPILEGAEITTFKEMAEKIDSMVDPDTGKQIHTAIRYGITQAILDAVAKSKHCIMAEVIAEEYKTGGVTTTPIPIFTQSGDNRYDNTDKMILKGANVLPHGLINHVETKLGKNGELLVEYVKWLAKRSRELAPYEGYQPIIHIDVYGTIGIAFNNDWEKITDYFAVLADAADGLTIRIEGPVDMGERTAQMEALKKLTAMVDERGINLEIVADEWCNTYEDVVYFADNKAGHMLQIKTPDLGGINNTVEAVIYCNKAGVGAYQGGTCNETNRSAEVCVNLAMATKPLQILAKPGMGVDEGLMIVYNEMQRVIAFMQSK